MATSKGASLNYETIAVMQIDAAIDLYGWNNLQGFICATTLAHAAEGVLSGLLPNDKKPSLHLIADALLTKVVIERKNIIDHLNKVPNQLKHCIENTTEFEPRLQALVSLQRAIANYNALKDGVTKKMKDFSDTIDPELYS